MTKVLSFEEAKKCLIAWREFQNQDALTILVECNLPLVYYFAHKNNGRGLSFDELVSAGNEGLVKAINFFDYINKPIEMMPMYMSVIINRYMKKDIENNNKHANVLSFEDTISNGDDDLKLEDILGTDADELFDNVISNMKNDIVKDALKSLTHREQQIILLKYGLDDKLCKSSEEIANIVGCSRQNIRILERRAITKMRHPRNTKRLKEFLD